MTRRGGALALVAAILLGWFPGSPTTRAAHAQSTTKSAPAVVIGTGSPSGVYFAVGHALCRLAQRPPRGSAVDEDHQLPCGVQATGGTLPNVDALRSGTMALAILQSDGAFNAVKGLGRFEGKRVEKLRSLFSLHAEPFQLLAQRSERMGSFVDLKGRKVNIGPKGTAQHDMFSELFKLHDMDERSLAQVLTLPPSQQIQAFCEGDVEALGMLIGFPNAGFAKAMRQCNAQLINADTEPIRRLVAGKPYYTMVQLPKDTYPSMPADITTFGVVAVLSTTSDVSPDTVYRLVRRVFEQLDDLRAMHPALRQLDPQQMIRAGLTAPLHEGALRYYRERGWMR
jgi:uncharacterized protein